MRREYNLEDLEKALDAIPYQIALQNDKEQYIYVNNALANKLHMDKEDIVGKTPDEILAGENYISFDGTLDTSLSDGKGVFTEMKSPLDKKWYDLYRSVIHTNGKTIIASVANELNINMTRVYNNLYYTRKKDSLDLLGYSDILLDRNENIVSEVEFKKRISLLCEDLQHKVNADGVSIYLIDDNSTDINLFIHTGEIIELCDSSKKRLFHDRNIHNKYNKVNTLKNCPKECKLFYDVNSDLDWHFTVNPIKYGSKAIGIMVLYYSDRTKIKLTADDLIDSICYKFGILCENRKMRLRLEKESKENMENKNKLKFFMDTSRDFWAIIKPDGTVVKISQNLLDASGWSIDDFEKYKLQDFIHPDDHKPTENYVKSMLKTHTHEGSHLINRLKCNDGTYKLIQWCWVHNNSDDLTTTLIGKDITLQHELEQENQKINAELEVESSKLEFFSNMSHEFRTPLNIILNSSQLMDIQLANNEMEKAKTYLRYIRQNSYRLLKLTNNILDVSKIDYGAYNLNFENCNIVELIENIVTSVADYIKSFNNAIIFDTDEEEIITACDTNVIERIMLNLLSNALKYVNENGTIEVKLSLDRNNNRVLVSVWDDGISISKENAEKIFEKFNKIDNSLTRRCEGGGIGLSLTRSFVEMHKGRIWANTEIKTGAEIVFSLPIKKASESFNTIVEPLDTKIEKCNIEFSDIYSLY